MREGITKCVAHTSRNIGHLNTLTHTQIHTHRLATSDAVLLVPPSLQGTWETAPQGPAGSSPYCEVCAC